mgnify:CR=1 FL=1
MLLKKKDIEPEMRKNNAADRKIMSNADSFPSSPYASAELPKPRATIQTRTDKSTAMGPFFGHPIHAALAVSCSSNSSSNRTRDMVRVLAMRQLRRIPSRLASSRSAVSLPQIRGELR